MSENAPLVAPIRRINTEILSRQTASWGGVRAELISRAASAPDYVQVQLPQHALFFTRRQRGVPVRAIHDDAEPFNGKAGTGHIHFIAAQSSMRAEHPQGNPETVYLALFIDQGEMSRLESDDFDPFGARLRSGCLGDDPLLPSLLSGLAREVEQPGPMSRLFADSATLLIISQLVRRSTGQLPQVPAARGGLAPYQLKRVTDYIGDRLTDELSLGELANLVGLSAHHFCRVFKQSTGLPPHRWQIQQRVEKAKALMLGTDQSLAEIAVAAGFSDQSHFTTVFRKSAGATPNAWRRATRS